SIGNRQSAITYPPERARMLQSWKHSGFNVHRSRRVQPDEREDLERRLIDDCRMLIVDWRRSL
ncbi:MAG: hypothetical protein WCI03_15250, partial [bacterium]